MRSTLIQTLTTFAFLAVSVKAQTPAFRGELLLEPGINSAKCLTAASNNDGAFVTIQPCNGGASQKWTFSGGNIIVFGNKCLDATDGSTTDGTKMQIWSCGGNNPNQAFSYSVWDNRITWVNKGKCVDLSGGRQDDGNQIQIWSCRTNNINQVWKAGYSVNALPQTSQDEQYGTNNCGTGSSQTSRCQTAWINSASDFCLWAPPYLANIGDSERMAVAYCTKSGRGTRTIPDGTLKGVHFVKTPEYVQVTGVGNFTNINVPQGDDGGELDNRGADGRGNPIGGLLYGNGFGANLQYHEWTSFLSDDEFCIRACVGARATALCNHIYDIMGCYWNIPANYNANQYEDCDGNAAIPMGVYGTSTWYQGASSYCLRLSGARRRDDMFRIRGAPAFPGATPAPSV
ncbi:hypothetical protein NLJ89_g3798 [Agrocybe chaxingu]|uniref:Ricin B lectin domain-containing protein n=1 Tax=Agrocybe chaxingu TaxID=84603 RepID=A0A9W8K488_9AGAR|nr:hypothetical protein NLJ89_g3798 [Agrocybe chaxingu]